MNLESAAKNVLETGQQPFPAIPAYEEKNMQNWMSYVPPTAREYPAALGKARKRETEQIESGVPETYRRAAQGAFRRGITGSGIQMEQVGLAGLDLQNRIAQARSREELDPMQAQIALEDRARQAYIDRGRQELADFQRQEDVTTAQRRQDQEMKARLAAAGIGVLAGKNAISSAAGNLLGGAGTFVKNLFGPGTAEASGYTPPLFGTGMIREDMENVYGTGTGTNVQRTNFGDITPYEDEAQFPMADAVSEADRYMMEQGEGGSMYGGIPDPYIPIDQTYLGTGGINMEKDFFENIPYDKYGMGPKANQAFSISPQKPFFGSEIPGGDFDTGGILDAGPYDSDSYLGFGDMDMDDFGQASNVTSKDALEALKSKDLRTLSPDVYPYDVTEDPAYNVHSSIQEKSLDLGHGLKSAQKVWPESETTFEDLGTLSQDIMKAPFQALGAGMKAVGSAKKEISNVVNKALDTATGGLYGGAKKIVNEAAKEASGLTGGLLSPSTVSSLALTALRGGGIKGITKDPLGFAGKKVLSSGLPSLKSTVGALSKGSLPTMASTPFGASQLAANAAYDAALAQGLSVQAADKAALAASNTAMTPLGASVIGLPMLAMSIGQQQAKKSRAKEAAEYARNLRGSASFNYFPGDLWMAGRRKTSPELNEANDNFRKLDIMTGIDKIFLEDPRRSVMGGKSLSEMGQEFARIAGITYFDNDEDVQNMAQKILGKKKVYADIIPGLREAFVAGLRNEISRDETEAIVSEKINTYMKQNPVLTQIFQTVKRRDEMREMNRSEGNSFVEDQINALTENINQMRARVPFEFKKAPWAIPETLEVEFIEDEQE